MPAAWKNSAMSRASGAPPETANSSRPPSAAWSFEKTSLWAGFRFPSSTAGLVGFPDKGGWDPCPHAQDPPEPRERVRERQEEQVHPPLLRRRGLPRGA